MRRVQTFCILCRCKNDKEYVHKFWTAGFTVATRNVDPRQVKQEHSVNIKQEHSVNINQYCNQILSNDSAQVPRKLVSSYVEISDLPAPYR